MAKTKILVVDDDVLNTKLVHSILTANNYEVVTAGDGQEGLEKVESENPDLVILDIVMPKMDGYTFVKEMRAKEIKSASPIKVIPIIVVTGSAQMSDLFELEGVRDYLVKPFKEEALLEKVQRHLI